MNVKKLIMLWPAIRKIRFRFWKMYQKSTAKLNDETGAEQVAEDSRGPLENLAANGSWTAKMHCYK